MFSTASRNPGYSTMNEANQSTLNHTISMAENETVRGGFNQQHDQKLSPWSVIENLDTFFKRVYKYHQNSGYICSMLKETLGCTQFIYVVFLATYLYAGIDYPRCFGNLAPKNGTDTDVIRKIDLTDCLYPWDTVVTRIPVCLYFLLAIAAVVLAFKLLKLIYHWTNISEMKQFYNHELNIPDDELDNIAWQEVLAALKEAQKKLNLSKSSPVLSALDIYHHILRQENYMVALVNKRILPPRITVPLLGEIVYWTRGLAYNMKLLLFYTSPFGPHWKGDGNLLSHLSREIQVTRLRKQILQLAFVNLLLSPIIFLWQILNVTFSHLAIVKREPGVLAVRRWSLYGRLYMRHFNELDHELETRLSKAHRPATRYMQAFTSPLQCIISTYLGFFVTSICAVLIVCAIFDEDILYVHPVMSIFAVCGTIAGVCHIMVRDETIPWCPEILFHTVVKCIHYFPSPWMGQAHTSNVRKQFQQLFQYTAVGLLEEVLSPIMTPVFLVIYILPRAGKIVDFFNRFTIKVDSVGDICSFAQMDLRKHGNMAWIEKNVAKKLSPTTVDNVLNDGKVEMSLLHFMHINPTWKPPHEEEKRFVETVQMETSALASRQAGDVSYNGVLDSSNPYLSQLGSSGLDIGVSRFHLPELPYIAPLSLTSPNTQVHLTNMRTNEGANVNAARDMSISAVYIHDMHARRLVELQSDVDAQAGSSGQEEQLIKDNVATSEKTPLLPSN